MPFLPRHDTLISRVTLHAHEILMSMLRYARPTLMTYEIIIFARQSRA